jgi:hypothetical protein
MTMPLSTVISYPAALCEWTLRTCATLSNHSRQPPNEDGANVMPNTDAQLDAALAAMDAKTRTQVARNRAVVILADNLKIPEDVSKLLAESPTVASALDWSTVSPEDAKEWIKTNHPTLLPVETAKKADPGVDQGLLRDAANGSMTAKSLLYKQVKDLPKLDALIAEKKAEIKSKISEGDHKGNPWSKVGWNKTEQSRVYRALGAECYSACNFDPLGAGIGVQN